MLLSYGVSIDDHIAQLYMYPDTRKGKVFSYVPGRIYLHLNLLFHPYKNTEIWHTRVLGCGFHTLKGNYIGETPDSLQSISFYHTYPVVQQASIAVPIAQMEKLWLREVT